MAFASGPFVLVNSSSGFAGPRLMCASACAPSAVHPVVRVAANRPLVCTIAAVSQGSRLPTAVLNPVLGDSEFTDGVDTVADLRGGHGAAAVRLIVPGAGGVNTEDHADNEARMYASNALKLVCFQAKLEVIVDLDSVPEPVARELRAVRDEITSMDPVSYVYHWVTPRFDERVRSILGDEEYKILILNDVDKLDDWRRGLTNKATNIIRMIEPLMAQTKYSILHPYPDEAGLPINHPVHDISNAFLKTLSGIAAELYFNIHLRGFKCPLPLNRMAANHVRALLHAHESITDFYNTVKELEMQYKILLSEEFPADVQNYLVDQCEVHTMRVGMYMDKLTKDMRGLRLPVPI